MFTFYTIPKIDLPSQLKHKLRDGQITTIYLPTDTHTQIERGDITEIKYTDQDTDHILITSKNTINYENLDLDNAQSAGFQLPYELQAYLKNRYNYISNWENLQCFTIEWINTYKMQQKRITNIFQHFKKQIEP